MSQGDSMLSPADSALSWGGIQWQWSCLRSSSWYPSGTLLGSKVRGWLDRVRVGYRGRDKRPLRDSLSEGFVKILQTAATRQVECGLFFCGNFGIAIWF